MRLAAWQRTACYQLSWLELENDRVLSAMTQGHYVKEHYKRPTWTKHRLTEKARHRNDQRGWTTLP
ncbi:MULTISPECIES: hypothetical protein [Acetobacter]|uniref:hypothetical protein n=1 Tax=Acetobacter TaxID=434 RepID=UPI0026A00932